MKHHLAPAYTSGPGGALVRGGDVPSDGASCSLMAAQFAGPNTQAEKVAMGSVDRIRSIRAPHMKYKSLLPNGAQSMDKALEYLRWVS